MCSLVVKRVQVSRPSLSIFVKTPKRTILAVIKEVHEDSVSFLVNKNLETYKFSEIKANLAEWPKTPR